MHVKQYIQDEKALFFVTEDRHRMSDKRRQTDRETDRQLLQKFQDQQSELPLKHIQSKIHCQDEFPIFAKKSPKTGHCVGMCCFALLLHFTINCKIKW